MNLEMYFSNYLKMLFPRLSILSVNSIILAHGSLLPPVNKERNLILYRKYQFAKMNVIFFLRVVI